MNTEENEKKFHKKAYWVVEWISFLLLTIFATNPFTKLFILKGKMKYTFLQRYNIAVLLIGVLLLAVCWGMMQKHVTWNSVKVLARKHMAIIMFAFFGLLMVITTLLNGAPEIAFKGDSYRGEGLWTYLSYIIYFLLAACLVSEKKKKWMLVAFLVTSTLVGGVIVFDYTVLDVQYDFAGKGCLVLRNSNHLGYYLLMSTMLYGMMFVVVKTLLWKLGCLCGFTLMTATLLMNDTWGCQLALFVGIIFTTIVCSVGKGCFRPKPLILLVVMIATFTLAYFTNDRLKEKIETNIIQQIYDTNKLMDKDAEDRGAAGSGRLRLWEHTIQYVMERPLVGHGADVTGDRLMEDAGNDRCHCEFLNYAVSFGVPATIVYMTAIFMVFWRGLKKKKQLTDMNYVGLCVAFTYLTSSLVGNSMYYTAPFLFIALGIGYVTDAPFQKGIEIS